MQKIFAISILSLLIIASPVLALNVSVSVDKTKVLMGDTIVLSGKITNDDGTTGTFQYRAAVVAPKGILVCDSNKTTTSSNGTFSLSCKLPTVDQANVLGIPAATKRSAIPYVAGVAVKDTANNQTIKKHAKEIIASNQTKLSKELDEIIKNLDNFVNESKRFSPQCDNIAEKAVRYNLTDVTEKCLRAQERINSLIANVTAISEQAKQLKGNATAGNIQDFRDSLKTLKENMKELRDDIKDTKETVKSVKWETLKEIKSNREEIKQEIEKKREDVRNEIKVLRPNISENKTRGISR